MKIKVRYIIFMLFVFSILKLNVYAGSVSIWANASSIKVGQNVVVSVSVRDVAGSFKVVSSNSSILSGGTSSSWLENNTYTYTFKANKTGTAQIIVSAIDAANSDETNFTGSKSVTINVVNASSGSSSSGGSSSSSGGTTIDKKKYSSDNNLLSLSVKGYDLTPRFDKDTTEYKLDLDSSVEDIDIDAKVSDDKASIDGIGNKKVSEGLNTFEIKVTAENGNEKIYKIIVNVSDNNPITVKIGKKKYTVIKKNNNLIDKPEDYDESIIKISNQDVVAYVNDKVGYTLVLLKDSNGNIDYYIYNLKNDSYTLYQEYKFGNIRLNILEMDKKILPDKYFKSPFTYNDEKIIAYQVKNNSKFYLFYAMNINTGKKNLYSYDSIEDTVQRYNQEEVNLYKDLNDDYSLFILIGLGSLGIVIVIISIIMIVKTKKKKKKYNYSPI